MKVINLNRLYKNKYYIAFYDRHGEEFIEIFDNIHEILKYKKINFTSREYSKHVVELYRSLRSEKHYTKMLNGTLMTVWLVDKEDVKDI